MPGQQRGYALSQSRDHHGQDSAGDCQKDIYDRRSAPFVVCLVTAISFVVLRLSPVENYLGTALNRVFAKITLPRMRLSSYALVFGIVAYAAAQAGQIVWESHHRDMLAQDEAKVLVAFTLPSRTSSTYANALHEDLVGELEKELFDSTRDILRDVFSHVRKRIEILPAGSMSQPFETLRRDFSTKPSHRTMLAAKLAAHRQGVGSPVDLAVGAVFTLISVEQRRIDFVFRLYRLERPGEADKEPQLRPAWPEVQIDAFEDEIYRASLVATARLAKIVADESSNFSENDRTLLWSNLNNKFRDYYAEFDPRKDERGEEWEGHSVFRDQTCSGHSCLLRWLLAYAEEQIDDDAAKRLDAERRKALTPLARIAQDGREIE